VSVSASVDLHERKLCISWVLSKLMAFCLSLIYAISSRWSLSCKSSRMARSKFWGIA